MTKKTCLDEETVFHKKVYTKLDASPFSENIKINSETGKSESNKKIIPSSPLSGMREEFKKTFLPLLIDIFELRQMIDNYKSQASIPFQKEAKSPKEILERLEIMQTEIEESQRWCEGVILQIAKGIQEAKEALELLSQRSVQKDSGMKALLKKLLFWRK